MSQSREKEIDNLQVTVRFIKRVSSGYATAEDEARLAQLMETYELITGDQLLRDLCSPDMVQVGHLIASGR